MDDTSLHEQKKYEKTWSEKSYRYHSPGLKTVPLFLEAFDQEIKDEETLTDFGCGTGNTAIPFLERGLNVHLVDIASNCLDEKIEILLNLQRSKLRFTKASLWEMPSSITKSDWIYCTDVLEHIPTIKVDATLKAMSERTGKGGLIQIYHQDASFNRLINEKLHLTIRSNEWWQKRLAKYWRVVAPLPLVPGISTTYLVQAI